MLVRNSVGQHWCVALLGSSVGYASGAYAHVRWVCLLLECRLLPLPSVALERNLAGGFGFGWLADFFRIPRYVAELQAAQVITQSHAWTAKLTWLQS